MFEEFIPGREMTVAVLARIGLCRSSEIVPDAGVSRLPQQVVHEALEPLPGAGPTIPDGGRGGHAGASGRCSSRRPQAANSDFARIDFRLSPESQSYCLEVNTIPGMTPTSLVPKAAKAAGLEFDEIVERILKMASSALAGDARQR